MRRRLKGQAAKIALGLATLFYVAFSSWYFGNGLPLAKLTRIYSNPSQAALADLNYIDWGALACVPVALIALYLILRAPRPPAAKFFRIHERYMLVFLAIAVVIGVLCIEVYDARNKVRPQFPRGFVP